MAEFLDLIKIKKRICDKYRSNKTCDGCPVHEICSIINVLAFKNSDFEEMEKILVQWDKEHQGPVYPTWAEWFKKIGIAPQEQKCFHLWLLDNIPADIAQKLDIKPEEQLNESI